MYLLCFFFFLFSEAEESLCMALVTGYTVWAMDSSMTGMWETRRWDGTDFLLFLLLSALVFIP